MNFGRGSIDRYDETGQAGLGKLLNLVRSEQSPVGHDDDLHLKLSGPSHDGQQVRMQRGLAAGQYEIANALPIKDVDSV